MARSWEHVFGCDFDLPPGRAQNSSFPRVNKPSKNASPANAGADSKEISAAIQMKLLDTIPEQAGSIIMGLLTCVAVALFCYYYSHQSWTLIWAYSVVFLLGCRVWLAWLYQRNKGSRTPKIWANRFALGGILTAFTFGFAAASAILLSDPFLQMIVISTELAYVTISAVRNNAVPRLAILQGLVPLSCSSAACFATGDKFYIIFACFASLHMVTVLQIVRFLYRRTLSLLLAEERAAEAAEALTEANARLQSLAATDTLTGVMNRRGFEIALAAECGRAARFNEEFSLLLLDIDYFKALNDTHGHQFGDECLRQIGACLQTQVRAHTDVAARYGGEEFVIILPKTNYFDAGQAAERVRASIEALALPHPTSPFGVTTVSIGYATFEREVLEEGAAIVKAADKALYDVKRKSRNAIAGWRDLEEATIITAQLAAG